MPWLHEMKWPEVKEYMKNKDVILIPIVSTEQQNRHEPLGTYSFVAIQLAEEASKEAQVVPAPPLFFGWSPHHIVLPWTISIEPSVLESFLFQMIKSLSMHGFRNFVVINGYRITNLPWMQIASQKAQSELGMRVVIFDPTYMSKEITSELGFGPIGHAEEAEISQMFYIWPELVKLDDAVDSVGYPIHCGIIYHLDLRSTEDNIRYVPSTLSQMEKIVEETGANTGMSTKTRVDLGKWLHRHLLKRLLEVIEDMEKSSG